MITLHARGKDIARLLLESRRPRLVGELARQLGVSVRTVRYDLKNLTDWLKERNLELTSRPRVGVWITGSDEAKQSCLRELRLPRSSQVVLSPKERVTRILVTLLKSESPVPLKELAMEAGVSRTTVIADLKSVTGELARYKLKVVGRPRRGVLLCGSEESRREMLVRLLTDMVDESDLIRLLSRARSLRDGRAFPEVGEGQSPAFAERDFVAVSRAVSEVLPFALTDSSYAGLVVHLSIAIERLRQGHSITMAAAQLRELQKTYEFSLAKDVAAKLETSTGVTIPPGEVGYITLHLLGSQLRQETSPSEPDDAHLAAVIERLVEHVGASLQVRLDHDIELRHGLYLHLKRALNRMRFNLKVVNPLSAGMKSQYPELMAALRSCGEPLLGGLLADEAELVELAMHFAAALERQWRPSCLRTLLVCSTGVGAARLLEARLRRHCPELMIVDTVSALEAADRARSEAVDLIVSTIQLSIPGCMVVKVSPLITDRELYDLRQRLGRAAPLGWQDIGFLAEDLVSLAEKHGASNLHELRQQFSQVLQARLRPAKPPTPPLPDWSQPPLPYQQFALELGQTLGCPCSEDVAEGIAIHLLFAMERLRRGQRIEEPEAEIERYLARDGAALEQVRNQLAALFASQGLPPPSLGEAVAVLRYFPTPESTSEGVPVHRPSGEQGTDRLLEQAVRIWQQSEWPTDGIGIMALRSHLLVFMERLRGGAPIEPLPSSITDQIAPQAMEVARQMLAPWFTRSGQPPAQGEIALVALHLVATKERLSRARAMKPPVKVVIGDRLGNGQRVARGVEEAGGVAILIPGVAADLRLGEVMQREQADLGLSFCGGGGAGATVAAMQYGYKVACQLHSIEDGLAALRRGARVLGFVFMDVEELGQRVTREYSALKQEGKR